jgi:hypothetical protein
MLRKQSLILLFLCLVFLQDAACCQPVQEKAYMPGQVLVKFNQGVSQQEARALHDRLGSTILVRYQGLNTDLVKIKSGLTVEEVIRLYREDPHVAYAEPNYIRKPQPEKGGGFP